MKLSKRTEYGLRAIIQLARQWPAGYIQSRDLARQEEIPNKFLESILLTLRRGNFLESKVGAGGGYRLARPPRQILLGQILRRLEGRLNVKPSLSPQDVSAGALAVDLVNQKLTDAIEQVLDSMTLEQLLEQVARAGGAQQAMYYI